MHPPCPNPSSRRFSLKDMMKHSVGNLTRTRFVNVLSFGIVISAYVCFYRLPAESAIRPYIPFAVCMVCLIFSFGRNSPYSMWELDKKNNRVLHSTAFTRRTIRLDNTSQWISGKDSIRIFYSDGSDKTLPLRGLPDSFITEIRTILESNQRVDFTPDRPDYP